ncbi:MAG: SPOR domain-containing protein [Sterolibacterium sp.]|nr:SPOR domain-containing protein [Sterolibacterium sp.]
MTRDTQPDIDAAHDGDEEAASQFKRRLLLRAGVAALLIAVLLAGLSMFDEANQPQPKAADQLTEAPTQPASLPAAAADTVSAQVPPLTENSGEDLIEMADADEAAAAGTVEDGGAASDFITPPGRPLTRPATAQLATLKPPVFSLPESTPPLRNEAGRALQRQAQPAPAPVARPSSRSVPGASGVAVAVAGKAYLLQLGVFNNLTHAEELRAKLELNGIPAQIEARVQVGPYASREEAEQIRSKLRQLGLEEAVLVATKK